ncbi:MAG: hypothetical protein SVZ03_06740 [Spirochaetota bacterium]|nr:hypothetical protein [Spirochaetota bacterium]
MKKFDCLVSAVICVMVLALWPQEARSYHRGKLHQIHAALAKRAPVEWIHYENTDDWRWGELAFNDEQYPLTIDVLENRHSRPDRVAFLVTPSGYNFRNNYFAPREKNIAHFLRENGYLVVSITFREDVMPEDNLDPSVREWGIEKHVADMHKIVRILRRAVRLPYEFIGQSSGAVCIMDYASKFSHPWFEKIGLIDTDSFDPDIYPEKVAYSGITYDAIAQLMDEGILVDTFAADFKELIFAAALYPEMDSGQPRPEGLPGNFTLNGLLHFSLIYTAFLPGLTSPITGLPGEWVMIQGVCNGYYNFDIDPLQDDFGLTKTDHQVMPIVAADIGQGTAPLALAKDMYGLLALSGDYTIDWCGIEERVVMVNGEFSSGDQSYYGTLIQNAGNSDVTLSIINGYGYADLLWGTDAEAEVWPYLID